MYGHLDFLECRVYENSPIANEQTGPLFHALLP